MAVAVAQRMIRVLFAFDFGHFRGVARQHRNETWDEFEFDLYSSKCLI